MTIFQYHTGEGCGNDFVLVDLIGNAQACTPELFRKTHQTLKKERKDSALIVKNDDDDQSALKMLVLEQDYSFSDFCGNGARVIASYLRQNYEGRNFFFKSARGSHSISYTSDGYGIHMGQTSFSLNSPYVHAQLYPDLDLGPGEAFYTETLEPHLVVSFAGMTRPQLKKLGRNLNNRREVFPLGINVNHLEVVDKQTIRVTTYERGVNGITKSCGTGSTSCAALARHLGLVAGNHITVLTEGGTLTIAFDHELNATTYGTASISAKPRDLE